MKIKVIVILYRICSSHRHVSSSEKLYPESWGWFFICFCSSPWNRPCVSHCWQLESQKRSFLPCFSQHCSQCGQRACQHATPFPCQVWGAETLKRSCIETKWATLASDTLVLFIAVKLERHFCPVRYSTMPATPPQQPSLLKKYVLPYAVSPHFTSSISSATLSRMTCNETSFTIGPSIQNQLRFFGISSTL